MAEFDINSIIGQITEKAAGDNDLLDQLKKSPAKALENMTGIDIPDEQIDAVIDKLGGIDGLVENFTSGDGIGGVLEDVQKAAGDALGGNILEGIGDMLGGDKK